MKLLLIEDADRLRRTTAQALRRLGHVVDEAATRDDGDLRARAEPYDVIVLDRMLPGGDGLDALAAWRRAGIATPVLVLTALGAVEERVAGFGHGADDYLQKPFAFDELAARLEALCRRGAGAPVIRAIGPLAVDPAGRRVTLHDTPIELGRREFALIELLSRRPGHIYSRGQIEERLYSDDDSPLSNAVDAAIYKLRRKLHTAAGTLVQTHRGLGYALEWQPT